MINISTAATPKGPRIWIWIRITFHRSVVPSSFFISPPLTTCSFRRAAGVLKGNSQMGRVHQIPNRPDFHKNWRKGTRCQPMSQTFWSVSFSALPRITLILYRQLGGFHSSVVEMLRNSGSQLERIQNILSDFLDFALPDEDPIHLRQPRPRQQRQQRRRTKIDLGLRVRLLFTSVSIRGTRRTKPCITKAEVRQHALLMLGRTDKSSPVPDPPSPRAIERFHLKQARGPSKRLGRLRLDLDGPVRSPWNVKAARCFRKSFNKSQLYRQWPNEIIEEAFLRHTETVRTHYHQQIGRVSSSTTLDRKIRSSRKSRIKTVGIILSTSRA